MQGLTNTVTAYSNYLVDVSRLVYIVGQNDATLLFKKQLDQVQSRTKLNYKLVNELPPNTFKKNKYNLIRRGIIKVQWIDKIIDKAPQMIILVFNCSSELAQNEKWQDRLGIIIRKINKVYEILKSTNKQEIIMKIVVIISKANVVGAGFNIVQKIKDFLNNYQKDLHVIQYEMFSKDIPKLKMPWITQLQKNYDRKYKSIQKRMDQSFTERRLGCSIKIAIMAQLLNRRDDVQKYQQAYTSIKFRFQDMTKGNIDFFKFDQIKELRTVADVLILRLIKLKLANNKKLQDQAINHMSFFKMSNMSPQATHCFFYYEELIWRSSFIQNLFQIIHLYEQNQPLSKLLYAELINGVLTYLYYISQIDQKVLKSISSGNQLQIGPTLYLGCTNYLKQNDITDADIAFTRIKEIFYHRKDYIAKGVQLITRCKGMKLFDKNELIFLNTYLLRFYIVDGKFQALVPVYNEVMKMEMKRNNYFLLNQLLKQIKGQLPNIQQQNKIVFYSIAILICDYFQNFYELENYLNNLVQSLKKSSQTSSNSFDNDPFGMGLSENTSSSKPLDLALKKNSNIFKVQVFIQERFKPIEQQIIITIKPSINQAFKEMESFLEINFTHQSMKFENLKAINEQEIQIKINPLDYLKYDQMIQIKNILLYTADRRIVWKLNNEQLIYKKYQKIFIYTPIKSPNIQIFNPYQIYFLNETVPLQIKISSIEGCQVQAKFAIKEQKSEGKTETFSNLQEKLNLTNSKLTQFLKINESNTVYMKLNKIGEKKIQFSFHVSVKKICKGKEQQFTNNSKQQILKNNFSITKQITFNVSRLFDIIKKYKQTPSGNDLKGFQIPRNKKIAMHFQLKSSQNIEIVELGQHKNNKFFKYYKDILIKDTILVAKQKLKSLFIFELVDPINQKQFFLSNFHIKWKRLNLSKQIQNLYVDDQNKLKLSQDINLILNYSVNGQLKTKTKSSLIINVTNLQNYNVDFQAVVQNTNYLLRIGLKRKGCRLRPRENKDLQFEVLPIKAGIWKFPETKAYANDSYVKAKSQGNMIFIS